MTAPVSDPELRDAMLDREERGPLVSVVEDRFDSIIAQMKRDGEMPETQHYIMRVWRPVDEDWKMPASVGPAIVPFTLIETSDLGRSEVISALGGVPSVTESGPRGSVFMRRGPLSAVLLGPTDSHDPDAVASFISEMRGQWDAAVVSA